MAASDPKPTLATKQKMGRKLPPNELELYKRCDEVLHYLWDPIGVSGNVCARDEYYAYIPPIFALVNENEPLSKIVDALLEFETARMGLNPNEKKAQTVAEILLDWRKQIDDDVARELVKGR